MEPCLMGDTSGKSNSAPPRLELPTGGGAIRGIGEKFAFNAVTGTASVSVPLAVANTRGGFGPKLELSYNSGSGNGVFGSGWHLSAPSISRKTDRGLPRYFDDENSDTFILASAEDLVPLDGGRQVRAGGYVVQRFLPRVEGEFARIE